MKTFSERVDACILKLMNFEAFRRAKSIDSIKNLGHTLAEHTLKLLLYPNSYEYNKWLSEILNYLNTITEKLNLKEVRRLRRSYLKELLWEDMLGEGITEYKYRIKTIERSLNHTYNENKIDFNELDNALKFIYEEYLNYIEFIINNDEIKDKFIEVQKFKIMR